MRLDAPAQIFVPMSVINHESWHAVAAVCLRVPLREVRADRPIDADPGTLGLAHVRQVGSRSGLRRGLAVVLAPWCAEGRPFDWPLDPNSGGDEAAARVLVDVLDLTKGEYAVCVETTNEFVRLSAVKRAVTAVAHALREDGVLSGGRVHQLVLGDAPAPVSRTAVSPGASPSPGVGRDLTQSSPPSGSHVVVHARTAGEQTPGIIPGARAGTGVPGQVPGVETLDGNPARAEAAAADSRGGFFLEEQGSRGR